jgi:hypothetical protein
MDQFISSLKLEILKQIGRIDYILNMFADDLLVVIEEKFLVEIIKIIQSTSIDYQLIL